MNKDSSQLHWSPQRRVLYIQFNNPAALPPLEHSTRILAEHGWYVLALGAGQNSADALRFPPHPQIEVRMLAYCPPGWRQKLHFIRFCIWIWWCAVRWKPRWIYVSDMMACPAALALTLFAQWQVVYHEHDSPMVGDGARPSRFLRFVLWTRRQVARRAAFCVVPNSRRAQAVKEATATQRPLLTVWNCPERAEALVAPVADHNSKEFVLFYHGSIVPARLPMSVLQAMAGLPVRTRLRVAGYETIGHPGYVARLKAEARRLGIGDCFECLGPVPQRADLLAECRRADVGISLMPLRSTDLNEQSMAGASNKAFDYLACGVPVLVSELPDWKAMFVETGFGLACNPDDPANIAQAMRWFVEHPQETRSMGERGRERVLQQWNYEVQFEPILAKMMPATATN